MKRLQVGILAGIAAAAFPASAAPARHPAPQHPVTARDWTHNVVATPEGGFRMGNPAAPVKLVEYGSLTCPHCGHFAREDAPQLIAKYVRTGRVSYEYRNMVLNGVDVAAATLARCAGPSGFFKVVASLYAGQDSWVKKAEAIPADEKARIAQLPTPQRLARISSLVGLGRYGALGGVTAQRANQCLADPHAVDRLSRIYEDAANRFGVSGTPTFLINGARQDVNLWALLEPLIVKAGG